LSKSAPHKFIVFADGACSGNPGPGGWGAIVATDLRVIELGGFSTETTNNRMEMEAVLHALEKIEAAKGEGEIVIYTDSNYLIQGITKWVAGWKRKNWQTIGREDVKNKDLWIKLDEIITRLKQTYKFKWVHVAGHSGIPGNERVDEIATSFSYGDGAKLFVGLRENYSTDLKNLTSLKPAKSARPKATGPVIYLSLINGNIFRDSTWAACEARVKGSRGAKYKKVQSPEEEAEVLKSWGQAPKVPG
jgi:ribonuclease HI